MPPPAAAQADERPATLEEIIAGLAKAEGVSPLLAQAVARKESSLDPKAVGDSGKAIGLFQLHQGAATDTGTADRSDPAQNIRGGLRYLKQLSDRYGGDVQKTLMAYNGGMDGVDKGTVSPQAQAYAADIMAELSKGVRPTSTGTTPPKASPASADRQQPAAPPERGLGERIASFPAEVGVGLLKKGAERFSALSRKVFPGAVGVGPEIEFSTKPQTTGEKVGAAIEPIAEFAIPGLAITKTLKASQLARWMISKGIPSWRALLAAGAVEGAVQAPVAYGVGKSQGATEGEATFGAVVSGVAPVFVKALEIGGPLIREKAVKQLSRVFARGLENKGPMVDYALKTGNAGNKSVAEAAKIVRQAASDTLDLPIQASWGKWQTQLAQDVTKKGQTLAQALKGELGQQEIPKAEIVKALDELIETSAQHFAKVSEGGYRFLPYDEPLLKELTVLKGSLSEYGDNITIKNFVDIKRVWDDAVYSLSTVGKVGVSPEVLVSNAMKEARFTGANAIRQALEDRAPEISKLNEAFTHAKRLEDLVQKLYKVHPTVSVGAQGLSMAAGAGIGASIMPGGYPGHILGASLGAGTVRILVKAIESPRWQTLMPAMRNRLAQAIASGNADAVRQIVAPLLSAQAVSTP